LVRATSGGLVLEVGTGQHVVLIEGGVSLPISTEIKRNEEKIKTLTSDLAQYALTTAVNAQVKGVADGLDRSVQASAATDTRLGNVEGRLDTADEAVHTLTAQFAKLNVTATSSNSLASTIYDVLYGTIPGLAAKTCSAIKERQPSAPVRAPQLPQPPCSWVARTIPHTTTPRCSRRRLCRL
jgi:ABC-type transporter Mla subunit MlaD